MYSRDPSRRTAFAQRLPSLLPAACRPAPDARTAVDGAEIVILATNSPTPVLDASWLEPGSYVTTLGPKQQGRGEFGSDLPAAAALIVTDSLAQIDAYEPPSCSSVRRTGTAWSRWEVRASNAPWPTEDNISLFFSVGLAGAEALVLDRLTTYR